MWFVRSGVTTSKCSRLSGASFESADDEQLNNWHERLAIALRNVASPNVALWTHVIRRRERSYPVGAFVDGVRRRVERSTIKNALVASD